MGWRRLQRMLDPRCLLVTSCVVNQTCKIPQDVCCQNALRRVQIFFTLGRYAFDRRVTILHRGTGCRGNWHGINTPALASSNVPPVVEENYTTTPKLCCRGQELYSLTSRMRLAHCSLIWFSLLLLCDHLQFEWTSLRFRWYNVPHDRTTN